MKASSKKCILDELACSIQTRTFKGPTERKYATKENPGLFGFSSSFEDLSAYEAERKEYLELLNQFGKKDKEKRKQYGHQDWNFIMGCAFKGEPCSFENFTIFQSLQYGNCFTFNKQEKGEEPLKTKYSGPNNSGLDIVLNLEYNEYLPITRTIGARVVIHDPDEEPDPDGQGLDVGPGLVTSISMEKNVNMRLPSPYRDRCRVYTAIQSYQACQKLCVQNLNLKICSCVDPTVEAESYLRFCNLENATQNACLDAVMNDLNEDSCDCPLPCLTSEYALTLSSMPWLPTTFKRPKLMSAVEPEMKVYEKDHSRRKRMNSESLSDDPVDFLEQNEYGKSALLKVKIFYRNLEVKTYKQEPMFQNSELFGHLGGQLGLWMGISLVALFECFESLLVLLHLLFLKSKSSSKDSDI